MKYDAPLTNRADRGHIVADQKNRPAMPADRAGLIETLALKFGVADREDFIDDQDFRFQVDRHAKGQANEHAARIALHRCVKEFFDLQRTLGSRRICGALRRASCRGFR